MTPSLALRYLSELSTDIRAAVLLDDNGSLVAGTPDDADRSRGLARLALELLEAADQAAGSSEYPPVEQIEVSTGRGVVFAVRQAGGDRAGSARPTVDIEATRAALHDQPAEGRAGGATGVGCTLAVVAGRFALSSLMFYDLRSVLADLEPVSS